MGKPTSDWSYPTHPKFHMCLGSKALTYLGANCNPGAVSGETGASTRTQVFHLHSGALSLPSLFPASMSWRSGQEGGPSTLILTRWAGDSVHPARPHLHCPIRSTFWKSEDSISGHMTSSRLHSKAIKSQNPSDLRNKPFYTAFGNNGKGDVFEGKSSKEGVLSLLHTGLANCVNSLLV